MAYKKRVPKTVSYTKYVCSNCKNPADLQTTTCPSCKADIRHSSPWRLTLNLIFIAAFGVFAYVMMN